MFINAGALLDLARRLASWGGKGAFWQLYEIYGDDTYALLEAALSLGVVQWRREDRGKARAVYVLGRVGWEMALPKAERCAVEIVPGRRRIFLRTDFGLLALEPSPSYMLSAAQKIAEICGADYREVYKRVAEAVRAAACRKNILDRWKAEICV